MHTLEAIGKVLIVGLLFGAGLPAIFAVGLRLQAAGSGDANADGTVTAPNPALKFAAYVLYALVLAAIVFGILWITRQTILYYTDVKIFPSWAYK
ncbi:hypothetical protein GYA93_19195 [Gordonia desulfuricans]|uniref:Uncharacterized protein n=1 Tax=Gordonia desulfuricans TaxID=89051 RepID=A0A7K3LTW3_9ACTN|nr:MULTISPECIES: hypothetical protein [Gordonia]EMP14569.1 hypothetical protein ISGA_2201 [Gordonia sp. NB41Y]NDK91683.1 hypothetical protein [Gordonia desulfuricans]WLP92105.1 hypothetical protein Q9K23_07695 [Gordonia sp. NB41Y]